MKTVKDITLLDIRQFLPQQPPFILIDKLLHFDYKTTSVLTRLRITPSTPFVEESHFSAAGITENVAQSCAARVGFYDWLYDRPIRIGVIGEVKSLKIYYLPKTGDELLTLITPKAEALGILLAEAVVKDSTQNLIASCSMKIGLR